MGNEKILLNFCENIRVWRQVNELSLEEMAHRLGISVDMLTLLERGIVPKELEVNTLVRASGILVIAIDKLFFPFQTE